MLPQQTQPAPCQKWRICGMSHRGMSFETTPFKFANDTGQASLILGPILQSLIREDSRVSPFCERRAK
jgi:hypothetical protein